MDILSSHNGSDVAGLINEALEDAGSATTIGNECGSVVSSKLNEVFGDVLLLQSQSGSEWTQAVEEGVDSMEQEEESTNVVRFLHISDTHDSSTAYGQCSELMGNDSTIKFTFVTGDISGYAHRTYDNTHPAYSYLESISTANKLLVLPGNHDTYDMSYNGSSGQSAITALVKHLQGGMGVSYGDTAANISSYWYKDIMLTSRTKLRIIALDQYEIGKVRRAGNYYTMYSQAQVDWFIDRISELNARDYLIVAMHEPPVQNQSRPDTYAQGMSVINGDPQKLFMTNGLYSFGNRGDEPSLNLFPRIMRAYMHKESVNFTYNNKGGSAGDIVVNKTFTKNPATFLFYLGGHQHADFCYYLPDETYLLDENFQPTSALSTDGGDWSDQLMMYVTAADRSVAYSTYDDLGGNGTELATPSNPSSERYRINEYEIDFGAKTIKVTRYGDKNTSSGRVRNEVIFPFKKNQS